MALIGCLAIATTSGCHAPTTDTSDRDFRVVCGVVKDIGYDYFNDEVNSPLQRIAEAAPSGSSVERLARQMMQLDTEVHDAAVDFARLSNQLSSELRKVCRTPS